MSLHRRMLKIAKAFSRSFLYSPQVQHDRTLIRVLSFLSSFTFATFDLPYTLRHFVSGITYNATRCACQPSESDLGQYDRGVVPGGPRRCSVCSNINHIGACADYLCSLFGITSLQAYWYYHSYPNDSTLHRFSVGALWCVALVLCYLCCLCRRPGYWTPLIWH